MNQTIKIAIETLLEHRQHQDDPQIHARTPRALADFRANFRLQQGKRLAPRPGIKMQMLQAQ